MSLPIFIFIIDIILITATSYNATKNNEGTAIVYGICSLFSLWVTVFAMLSLYKGL